MTIGELLRLTGHIYTTVGMSKLDGKIYEDDGSWDGDVLVNTGVGFCQVQGEKPENATVVNKEWLVQGGRVTNPLKINIKAAKSQTVASSSIKECDVALAKRHKEKPASVLESCKALPFKNGVAEACANMLNKVISKDKALGDKSRSAKPSPHGNFARAFYSERISYFSQNYREINSFTL